MSNLLLSLQFPFRPSTVYTSGHLKHTLRVIQYLNGPGEVLLSILPENHNLNNNNKSLLTIKLEPTPLVLLHLLNRRPGICIRCQDLPQQWQHQSVQLLPRCCRCPAAIVLPHHVIRTVGRGMVPGQLPGQHCDQYNATGPNVRRCRVIRPGEYFRCHIR